MCERRTLRGGGGGGGGGDWHLTMATLLFCWLMMASTREVAEAAEMTCDQDAPATYTAAVVEFSPELGVTEENIAGRFKDNINAYREFINAAKKEDVDIIVFPECGLATLELPRLGDGSPAVSVDVSHIGTNPCIEEDIFHQQEMRDLSCAAREAGVYVVVNLPEHESCSPALAFCPECPGFDRGSVPSGVVACNIKGLRYFNTDVAFDRKGTVIARYRKFNLFGEPGFVAPTKAELSTFMTDFGVRFGMFTCFDLMFERPAVELVAEAGITDLIFPTAWFSELPFLTAIQAQAAWSWVLDVNMLAAGYNLPAVGSTGSGLYAGRHGVVAATMERTRTSKMLVGKLPNARSCKKSDSDVTQSGHTISLNEYEDRAGPNTFLGGQAPPKLQISKKAMELPKRKVELLYKQNPDVEAEDDREMLADEAEFREALAPRPDGTSKLIHGQRYRSYLKDLMMSRLKSKHERLTDGSSAVFKHKRSATNEEDSLEEDAESENKSVKKRRRPVELDDLIFGRRQLQKKSEKKREEEEESEPSIEEIALTMLSGLEGGGDQGEQLKEMVEKLQEDQEKSKLASKPQPSLDEMEGTLLGAMRELSGNMTAEGEIFGDVMMDLQETEQREAAERKFILERCQRILMEVGTEGEEEEEADDDQDEGGGLHILSLEEPKETLSGDSEPAFGDSDSESSEEAEVPDDAFQETIIPEVEGAENEVRGDENVLENTEFTRTEEELKCAENDAQTHDDAIPPPNDGAVESEEESIPPIEPPTSEYDAPAMEGYAGTGEEMPPQEDEVVVQEEDVHEEVVECVDETCTQDELEEEISSLDSVSSEDSIATECAQESLESPESELLVEATPSPMMATEIDARKYLTASDTSRQTPTTKSECSNYVTPEKIKYSKQKSSYDEKSEENKAFLYLKTEDLQKYASLLLTSQSIIENSTVTVCHGIFCCYFSVTIYPGHLPSPTGFKPSRLEDSAFRSDLEWVPLVKDETRYYAQKPEDLRNLVGFDNRGYYSRMKFLVEDDDEEDAEEEEKKDKGEDDADELADIDLSEMQPDDDDDDDTDLVADIHEGPVFLQSAVLQTLQSGESLQAGSITQEDMEPSEQIIQEEKKVKEREQKAISEGLVDGPAPAIPEPEQMKEEEEKRMREIGGDKLQSDEVTAMTEEVKIQEGEEGEEEPPTEDRDAETAVVEETTSEDVEQIDICQESQSEEELAPLKEAEREIQEPGMGPKDMEEFSESGICDCVNCWQGRDEALPDRATIAEEQKCVEEEEEEEEEEECEDQEVGEDEEIVEDQGDVDAATKTEYPGKKRQRKRAAKRYYYRIVVYNGLRTFDGIADGGLQVCAVVSCTGMSIDSCGKLHSEEDKVIPTAFEQVSIRGSFRRNRALPMPTTLGMDMMPLPARSFSLKEVPVADESMSELTMKTTEEAEFLSFGIYSRDFLQDPPRAKTA